MNQTIREVAQHMGFPDYQLRKWKMRRGVPHKYRLPMLEVAGKLGKGLYPKDFDFAAPVAKGRSAKRARA